MSSECSARAAIVPSILCAALSLCANLSAADLRVCADPNNLPFSNRQQEGFDNKIAAIVARDLNRTVRYTWTPERGESFVEKTLIAGQCDVLLGMPSLDRDAATTQPYYSSTYVFLWRRDRHLNIRSFNDPALRKLRIGVHIVSDDASNLPPAQALANRGMLKNMAAFSIYGDLSKPNPPARLIEAVSRGDVDMAIAWGPLAGYFAKRSAVPLDLVPVSPQVDRPYLPFTFAISMGVRPQDKALLAALNGALEKEKGQIGKTLEEYGVPTLSMANTSIADGKRQ